MIDTLLPKALAAFGGNGRALAAAIGCLESSVSQWKNGKREPSLASYIKLAKVTGDDTVEVCAAYTERQRRGRAA